MCTETGISYHTIASLYQRKSENISLEVLRIIARYLGVTLDYLIYDDIQDINYGKQKSPASAEADTEELGEDKRKLLKDYDALNDDGQQAALDYMDGMTYNPKYKKCDKSQFFTDIEA